MPDAALVPALHAATRPAPRASGQVLVRAEKVSVRRAGRWLIRGVDLGISRGEIVTVIGPNGSGKSTAAKVVLGLIKPDEGSVQLDADIRIGYVPQKVVVERTLPLSVARLMTLTRPHPLAKVQAALDAVGIAHLAARQIHDLSGGEFQRALLARALVNEPELLVLDEPVQGVDFTGEIALYELIRQVRDTTGCGVLLISHDLHVVMAHSDSVVCLNGHVCCHGSPQSVADDPEYIRLFGQRGAQSLALYRHDHDHTHSPDGSIQSNATVRGTATGDHDAHNHG